METKMTYVPDKGTGGAGSNHKGQSQTNGGFSRSGPGPVVNYPQTSISHGGDTAKPKDTSKKSPKIFG